MNFLNCFALAFGVSFCKIMAITHFEILLNIEICLCNVGDELAFLFLMYIIHSENYNERQHLLVRKSNTSFVRILK